MYSAFLSAWNMSKLAEVQSGMFQCGALTSNHELSFWLLQISHGAFGAVNKRIFDDTGNSTVRQNPKKNPIALSPSPC